MHNTNPIARLHHYLPQSYLGHFTSDGTKKGKFFVLDKTNGNIFVTSPRNVCAEKDFNRISIPGSPDDVYENRLSEFEGNAAESIRETARSLEFPNDINYNYILNLIALLTARNPRRRHYANQAFSTANQMIRDLCDQFGFGQWDETDTDTEDMIRLEISCFEEILEILAKRTWSLIVAPSEGPEFLCSDHPVVLFCKLGLDSPIGIETTGTGLVLPLSRRIGFYGTYENSLKPVVYAKPTKMTELNLRIAQHAERHVFSVNRETLELLEL